MIGRKLSGILGNSKSGNCRKIGKVEDGGHCRCWRGRAESVGYGNYRRSVKWRKAENVGILSDGWG